MDEFSVLWNGGRRITYTSGHVLAEDAAGRGGDEGGSRDAHCEECAVVVGSRLMMSDQVRVRMRCRRSRNLQRC